MTSCSKGTCTWRLAIGISSSSRIDDDGAPLERSGDGDGVVVGLETDLDLGSPVPAGVGEEVADDLPDPGRWRTEEKRVMIVFALTALAWVTLRPRTAEA